MTLRDVTVLFVLLRKKMSLGYFGYQKRRNTKDTVEENLQFIFNVVRSHLSKLTLKNVCQDLQSEIGVLTGREILAADSTYSVYRMLY